MHVPIHVLSRDGQSISGSRDTLTRWCSVHVPIHVLSQDGRSISGSRDTLTGGGTVPIHVLSRDGQSILGSQDTLTGGGGGGCSVHPCTLPGWSEYLGISGYSDRGGGAVFIHVLSRDGQSISGYSDRGGAVYM